jgi:uncharacterized membrane protein YhaH (DUF805 family)
MGKIRTSARHNLRGLARFNGRDSQRQFWPWAIIIFLVSQAAATIIVVIPIASAFARFMQMVAKEAAKPNEDPEAADMLAERLMADMASEMGAIWQPLAVVTIVTVALLAAAVTRRLHDRGRTGLWGLLPVPFLAVSVATMPYTFRLGMAPKEVAPMDTFLMLAGPMSWVTLIVLVVLLVGEGDPGSNRFGPEPPVDPA